MGGMLSLSYSLSSRSWKGALNTATCPRALRPPRRRRTASHPLPAAFLWDEAQSTFHNSSTEEEDRARLAQLQQNPKVGLHFNLEMSGADSFILTGEAKVSLDDPSFDQIPAWVAKYQAFFEHH